MFRKAATAVAILSAVLVASPAYATAIGYVDTARVLLTYSGAKSAQGQMAKELEAYQHAFMDRQKKIAEAVLQDVLLVQTRLREPTPLQSENNETASPSGTAAT